jgi:hypothetical protein
MLAKTKICLASIYNILFVNFLTFTKFCEKFFFFCRKGDEITRFDGKPL